MVLNNPRLKQLLKKFRKELNFFRIHVTLFVLFPLLCSAIFYASNGQYKISYVDSLFLCYSAMTVTGLVTVNLSTLTGWQQTMLFLLMLVGDLTFVSWVMVLIRKHYFRSRCEHMVPPKRPPLRRAQEIFSAFISSPVSGQRMNQNPIRDGPSIQQRNRVQTWDPAFKPKQQPKSSAAPLFLPQHSLPATANDVAQTAAAGGAAADAPGAGLGALRINIVGPTPHVTGADLMPSSIQSAPADSRASFDLRLTRTQSPEDRILKAEAASYTSSPKAISDAALPDTGSEVPTPGPSPLPTPLPNPHYQGQLPVHPNPNVHFGVSSSPLRDRQAPGLARRKPTRLAANMTINTATVITPSPLHQVYRPPPVTPTGNKGQGYGGFPNPFSYIPLLAHRLAPKTYKKLERSFTMAYTSTIIGADAQGPTNAKWLNIKKPLVVTGNSNFHIETLTDEELEKVGGVEYSALRLLSYVLPIYFVAAQLIPFIVVAAWLANDTTYDPYFKAQVDSAQVEPVSKAWSTAFFAAGSYTGSGLTLIDTGFLPFQKANLMLIFTGFAMLAGNHALPIFLRFIIWIMTKFVAYNSKMDNTLHFLLDHPRRFPSHITWFLVVALVGLSALELFAFTILNIGLPVTSTLAVGTRIMDGLFQSLAVRASGYAIVNLSTLAPSVQFLYVVMMYIAIYPVAMSIRSTNVYEEKSLGIFEEEPELTEEEPHILDDSGSRRDRVGKYLGWHLRRQLSYDLWWLIIAIWVICMLEREKLMDDVNAPWFNMFRIVFELVSAYGTIGLSLGIPTENYSFSGSMRRSSKFVVMIIMIRGRHRGLPVAVDRAVLLPHEYKRTAQTNGVNPNQLPENNSPIITTPVEGMNEKQKKPEV